MSLSNPVRPFDPQAVDDASTSFVKNMLMRFRISLVGVGPHASAISSCPFVNSTPYPGTSSIFSGGTYIKNFYLNYNSHIFCTLATSELANSTSLVLSSTSCEIKKLIN